MSTTNFSSEAIDVLIICALYEEFKALISVEHSLLQPWKEEFSNGLKTAITILATPVGNLTIKASWQNYMGQEQAIAQTAAIMQSHPQVRCIAMCGICAGRRGEIHLGDVIFADRLWSYENGKLIKENNKSIFKADILQYKVNNKILQRMQSFTIPEGEWLNLRPERSLEVQENWIINQISHNVNPLLHPDREKQCSNWTDVIQRLLKRKWINNDLTLTDKGRVYASDLSVLYPTLPPSPEFNYHIAPVGTGTKVVEDDDIFEKLSISMRKVLGIDMEASGIAALGDVLGIPVIIAKAVSDYGDQFKDQLYRSFAARAAAECLIKLISDSADLLLDVKQQKNLHVQTSLDDSNLITLGLIETLANLYSTTESIRSVWIKAGGKSSEVENNPHAEDLWLILWQKSQNGARVTPSQLLNIILRDYPKNSDLLSYVEKYI